MDNKKTGQLIRTLRMEKGISQKELAEKIQYSTSIKRTQDCIVRKPELKIITG